MCLNYEAENRKKKLNVAFDLVHNNFIMVLISLSDVNSIFFDTLECRNKMKLWHIPFVFTWIPKNLCRIVLGSWWQVKEFISKLLVQASSKHGMGWEHSRPLFFFHNNNEASVLTAWMACMFCEHLNCQMLMYVMLFILFFKFRFVMKCWQTNTRFLTKRCGATCCASNFNIKFSICW